MSAIARAEMNTKLESISVVYLDDRDARHPDRWKVYPFKWAGKTPMIFMNDEWVDASGGADYDFANNFQKRGFAYTLYGSLHLSPELTGDAYTAWWATSAQARQDAGLSPHSPNVHHEARACAVLGLTWPVAGQDIKAAYRQRAKALHPDMGGDAELFQELQSAYEVLVKL